MMKDLILLVADKNTQFVLKGLLQRHYSLQVSPIEYDIYIHPKRDPGIYREAADFLREYNGQYSYTLVFLDREGSGQENKSADQIAEEMKTNLEKNGWQNRADVIVFEPELEIWAWVNSPHLAAHTGWTRLEPLLNFVRGQGYWEPGSPKPQRPKEAFEAALREKRIPRSSAIYEKIAAKASFDDCTEPSFQKFRSVLQNWFSTGENN